MAVSAYLTANAIPFFKDLVALIGALTSVPLTLLLPALLYRKYQCLTLWYPRWGEDAALGSFWLVAFSVAFMAVATTGVLWSIARDWESHGRPFACG
uniref:Amino acid transporter transmembrane domain-containing protein n=1 Tax=Amphora coffeiformis TaxID=265554 RepID=A0A7S3PAZ7_9STRA